MLIDSVPIPRGSANQTTIAGTDDLVVLDSWAAAWARTLGATAEEVACYLLALGNAPSYVSRFRESVQSESPRMPATTDRRVFADAVAVGQRLLKAWCLESEPSGTWKQRAMTGTRLGKAIIEDGTVTFENGDQLTGVHSEIDQLAVSSYPVFQRYLEARVNCSLTRKLAADIRKVAGSVESIVKERAACDALLFRALNAPMLIPRPVAKAEPQEKEVQKRQKATGRAGR